MSVPSATTTSTTTAWTSRGLSPRATWFVVHEVLLVRGHKVDRGYVSYSCRDRVLRRLSTSTSCATGRTGGHGYRGFRGALPEDFQRIPVDQQRIWVIRLLCACLNLVIVIDFHHLIRYNSKLRVRPQSARVRRHVISLFWLVCWQDGSSPHVFACDVGLDDTDHRALDGHWHVSQRPGLKNLLHSISQSTL